MYAKFEKMSDQEITFCSFTPYPLLTLLEVDFGLFLLSGYLLIKLLVEFHTMVGLAVLARQ